MTSTHARRLLIATLATLLLWPSAVSNPADAQTGQWPSRYFSSYARAHRVTIRRNAVVVATFETPVGMLFSVYSDQPSAHRPGRNRRVSRER